MKNNLVDALPLNNCLWLFILYLFNLLTFIKDKGQQKKKELTLPYSLVDATWIVGPGNLPVLRTGINGT